MGLLDSIEAGKPLVTIPMRGNEVIVWRVVDARAAAVTIPMRGNELDSLKGRG